MRVKSLIVTAAAVFGTAATALALPGNVPETTDNTEPSYLLWVHLTQYDDCTLNMPVREAVRAEVDRVPELDSSDAVVALEWVLESSSCATMHDYIADALLLAEADMEAFKIEIGLQDAPGVAFKKTRPEGQRSNSGSTVTPLGLPPVRPSTPQGSDYEN